jgi:hypothetical protein
VVSAVALAGGLLGFRGEEEMVVMVVVAVRGRSPEEEEAPPPPVLEAGMCPVTSRRRILDFKSSNSSHTEDAAVVDTVDTESEDLGPVPAPATEAAYSVSSIDGPASSARGEAPRILDCGLLLFSTMEWLRE